MILELGMFGFIIIFIGIWNIIVFSLYGFDKHKARRGKWRISEKTLITTAVLMGGFGACAGMQFFRHKTKHMVFKIMIPLALIVNVIIIYILFKYIH